MPRSLDNKKSQARFEDDVLKAAKRWYHEQNELRKQLAEKYTLSPRGQDLFGFEKVEDDE
jgi:hypothetical protein